MNGRSWDIIGRRRFGYALSLLIILPGVAALILNAAAIHVEIISGRLGCGEL